MSETGKVKYAISFKINGFLDSVEVTRITSVEVNGEGEELIQEFYLGKQKCDSVTPPPFDPKLCDKFYVIGPGMGLEGDPKYFETFGEALAELLKRLLRSP